MTEEKFVPPSAPKDICFNELEFVQKVFDTDIFLQEHRKNVSLEKMRDDLGIYLKILRSAMIELINKDYADFVDLSSNLIGVDKAIKNLEAPLGQFKEEVLQVKQLLNDMIAEMQKNLNMHKEIRDQRQSLHSLIRYHKSANKLRNILITCDNSESRLKPDILERAAAEFNQLKFHINLCQLQIPTDKKNEMNQLDTKLKNTLNDLFINCILERDPKATVRCLKIYSSLDKVSDAELIVKTNIVRPAVENLICEHILQNSEIGLRGIYEKLEEILNNNLNNLLEATMSQEKDSITGFNFLVNSFWVEVEQRIEDYIPIIFAPGNPDLFHKRYMESVDFLLRLEQKYSTPDTIDTLKVHAQYQRFIKKWNLPVYFQIRFQEIAGTAESILSANVSAASIRVDKTAVDPNKFSLHASCIVWDCLVKIWAPDVYINKLLHRFFKLSLQLCSRYQEWCHSSLKQTWQTSVVSEVSHTNEKEDLKRLEFLVALYTDVEKFISKILGFPEIIQNKICNLESQAKLLVNDCINEVSEDMQHCIPLITQEIVNELLKSSTIYLKEISDIPRLFRRTNRDIPSKPCTYVKKSLDFLRNFYLDYANVVPDFSKQWVIQALTELTEHYTVSVQEVLTSVQKTEESLRRLKKIRDKSVGVSTVEKHGITDDEKIRIQLYIDVVNYVNSIKELGIYEENVPKLKFLIDLVDSAKSKSDLK